MEEKQEYSERVVPFCNNEILQNKTIEEKEQIHENNLDESMQYLEKLYKWYLKIQKIDLDANIEEDTSMQTLEDSVGHFVETSKWDGNIGLAAHNRGYKNNFFKRINELNYGDEIQYFYNGKQRNYKVNSIEYIENTDWSHLVRSKENKITLITCIENNPQYRLCVQGIEI